MTAGDDRWLELVPVPDVGRCFVATTRVRVHDCDADGRARLDAVARWVQEVGVDDTSDAGYDPDQWFVLRRAVIRVERSPRLDEDLMLTTFCGGTGKRWAERRVSLAGGGGASVEASALWVCIDRETRRPARLTPAFERIYAPAAQGRTVSARLRLGAPSADADRIPFPLRHVDIDVLGHVNNAVAWAAVEQAMALVGGSWREGIVAECEWRGEVAEGSTPTIAVARRDSGLDVWIEVDGAAPVAARVSTR